MSNEEKHKNLIDEIDLYYYLKKDEVIKDGDEVEVSNDMHTPEKWIKTACIGEKAPDPKFEAHRKYRRFKN